MRPAHLLTLLLLGFSLLLACGPRPGAIQSGSPAPAFRLPDLGGGELSSESLRGEVVVLNFWATWCGPCRREIPTLKALDGQNGARVVSIALDEQGAAKVRPFVEENGIDYTVLLGDKHLLGAFGGRAIPYTLVIDRSQQVVRAYEGVVRRSTLEKDIQRLNGLPG